MAAWSSALDCGAQPVVKYYYRGHAVGVRARFRIIVSVRVRLRFRARMTFRYKFRVKFAGLGSE